MSTAFLFPGQGRIPEQPISGSALADRMYDRAEAEGLRLREWIRDGNAERLTGTDASQPALLIDSLAREQALRARGVTPSYVAGHSLGEYAALVSAGTLLNDVALELVIERGRLMGTVSGAMAAILKLDLAAVSALCERLGPGVVVANHNAPTQIVVSGDPDAVKRVADAAAVEGGRAIPLPVSGPFHSPQMHEAEQALAPWIERAPFSAPSVPVVSSVRGVVLRDPKELRSALKVQMTSCVRWIDVLNRLEESGVTHAVEVGSGGVLTNLGRRATSRIRFVTWEEALDGDV